LSGLDCGRKQIIGSHPDATPSDATGVSRLLQMGGKFFVSGDPFILQALQNSRVLSLQGLHRGEQVVKYLLHNISILVHIPLLSKPTVGCKKRPHGTWLWNPTLTSKSTTLGWGTRQQHRGRAGTPVSPLPFRVTAGTP